MKLQNLNIQNTSVDLVYYFDFVELPTLVDKYVHYRGQDGVSKLFLHGVGQSVAYLVDETNFNNVQTINVPFTSFKAKSVTYASNYKRIVALDNNSNNYAIYDKDNLSWSVLSTGLTGSSPWKSVENYVTDMGHGNFINTSSIWAIRQDLKSLNYTANDIGSNSFTTSITNTIFNGDNSLVGQNVILAYNPYQENTNSGSGYTYARTYIADNKMYAYGSFGNTDPGIYSATLNFSNVNWRSIVSANTTGTGLYYTDGITIYTNAVVTLNSFGVASPGNIVVQDTSADFIKLISSNYNSYAALDNAKKRVIRQSNEPKKNRILLPKQYNYEDMYSLNNKILVLGNARGFFYYDL